jgi:glycosyltransferase involved in cell wall biosynthesis
MHTALLEAFELFLCRFVSFGTAVSATLSTYYARTGIQMLTLPVGVDVRVFRPDVPSPAEIVSWNGDSVLLAYAGNTKWYQGVEGVLEAFLEVHQKRPGAYKFLVIASSGAEDVRAFREKHGLQDVMRVLDKQPHQLIPSLLAAADVLTVVRPSDMVTEFSFPSKLPEYAALGKALIVSRVSDIGSYIKDGVNGLVVPPADEDALVNALHKLSDPEVRRRLGREARLLAEERFALDILGRALYDFVNARIA